MVKKSYTRSISKIAYVTAKCAQGIYMYRNRKLERANNLYGLIVSLGTKLQSLFLLIMRLTWGHQFVLIGSDKLTHIEKTTQYFNSLHISHPHFQAYLVGYLETIGGVLLIIGFASRLISIPLAIIMISALSTAHALALSDYRFITDPITLVQETPYPFLITSILILCFGPGKISVDGLIRRWVTRQPTL